MVADRAARGDNCSRWMLPNPMACAALLFESMPCHDGGDGVASCHGSVVVGEQGQGSECLISELLSVGTCQPLALNSDGEESATCLGCVVSLATCPHDAAGAEVGCHGEDHVMDAMGGVGGGGVTATRHAQRGGGRNLRQ